MKPGLASLALATLAACGPNYRYVYDGEAAFERCYGLDFDQGASPDARRQCWAAWLQSYSFAAGTDRVEYARSRVNPSAAPQSSGASPVTPPPQPAALSAAAPPPPPPPHVDAHAPPPSVGQRDVSDPWQRDQISVGGNPVTAPRPTGAQSAEAEPPGAACGRDCHDGWHGCGGQCAGRDAACVARCDDRYRECMRGCF